MYSAWLNRVVSREKPDAESEGKKFRLETNRRDVLSGFVGLSSFLAIAPTISKASSSSLSKLWSIQLDNGRTDIRAVDLNNDGTSEIAVSDIVQGGGPSTFGLVQNGNWLWKDSSEGAVGIGESGDVDDDGQEEILFGARAAFPLWVRPYRYEDSSYVWSANPPDFPDNISTIDYDGDGKAEVGMTSNYNGHLQLYDDNGDVIWDILSASLVEKTLGFRDVKGDNRPELLTHIGEDFEQNRKGLQLVKKTDSGVSQIWEYGPEDPLDAKFADLDSDDSLEVLVAYDNSGEFHGVSTDGEKLWNKDTSVTNGQAYAFDTGEDDPLEAAVWGDTTVAVYDNPNQKVKEFSTDSPVQRVESLGNGQVIVVTEDALAVAEPESGVLETKQVDRDVEGIAGGDVDGDGSVEAVIGFSDELVAYQIGDSKDEDQVAPSDVQFENQPPSAIEITEGATFKISIDPGSITESEIDATAVVEKSRWGDSKGSIDISLSTNSTETDRIELDGQLPPAENEYSSPLGLKYEIAKIEVNGTQLKPNDSSVTFAFDSVENTAVVFAKYSDSNTKSKLEPYRTRDELKQFQKRVERDVNEYYASQSGSMGAVGFEMEFYNNSGEWFTVKSSEEYDDSSFIGYIREGFTLDRKEFVLDSISEANIVSSNFDSVIGVSPGESESLYSSTGSGAAFNSQFIHVSEPFKSDNSDSIGIWCHELGHTLDAADLYDNGELPGGDLKALDLMANGTSPVGDLEAAPFSAVGRTKYNNLPWLQLNTKTSYSTYAIENKFNKEYQDKVFEFIPVDNLENSPSIIIEFRNDQRINNPIQNGIYIYETSSVNIDNILSDRGSKESLYPDPTLPSEGSMTVDLSYFYKCTLKTLPNGEQKKDAEIEISQPTSEAQNKIIASVDISPPDFISDDVEFDVERNIPTPDADLHAYDEEGNHIGPNYNTGEFENEISGSYVSGDRPGGLEWIAVPDGVNIQFKINTHDVQEWIQEAELSDADIDTSSTYQLSLTQYGDDPKVEETDGKRTITDSTTIISEEQTIAPGEESSAATKTLVDFDPDTLNVKSGGKWVTTYLTLPEDDISVEDIELSSIELNGEIEAVTDNKYGFVQDPTKDVDDDGTVEFIAKFPRGDVTELLETGENVRVTISGNTADDIQIIGSDRIEVTEPGR